MWDLQDLQDLPTNIKVDMTVSPRNGKQMKACTKFDSCASSQLLFLLYVGHFFAASQKADQVNL
jgi:hypothetical protein